MLLNWHPQFLYYSYVNILLFSFWLLPSWEAPYCLQVSMVCILLGVVKLLTACDWTLRCVQWPGQCCCVTLVSSLSGHQWPFDQELMDSLSVQFHLIVSLSPSDIEGRERFEFIQAPSWSISILTFYYRAIRTRGSALFIDRYTTQIVSVVNHEWKIMRFYIFYLQYWFIYNITLF